MKRGLGEEFALPYPNIRTKEGYVMKKKVLALALSLVVVFSVSACENSNGNNENKEESSTKPVTTESEQKQTHIKTSDFQKGTSNWYIENFYFDVPSNWIHEFKDGDWFYPTSNKNLDGSVWAKFTEYESSILVEENFKSYATEFTNEVPQCEIIKYNYTRNKNGIPAFGMEYSWIANGTVNVNSNLLCFNCDGGFVTIIFSTSANTKYDFSDDFNSIFHSIVVKEVEDNTQQEKNPQTTNITMGQQNALWSALQYLNTMAFSKSGLIDQLEYEGYSTEEATYAVENCGADWNEQAAKSAQNYINTMSFSRSGLIDQLIYEGFTREQAEYGVSTVGY